MNNASINVGIVGATGAVGQELLRLLHDRNFPMPIDFEAKTPSLDSLVEALLKKLK